MRDIYQSITDQIVQALENGVRPWHYRSVLRHARP
jgi:antirestriction protein ArdC